MAKVGSGKALLLATVVILVFLFAGCGKQKVSPAPQGQTGEAKIYKNAEELYADLAKLPAKERQERLIEGAKKEQGSLSYYTTFDDNIVTQIIKEAKALYPFMSVEYVSGSGMDLVQKVLSELRVGRSEVDAMGFGDALSLIKSEFPQALAKHYALALVEGFPKYAHGDYWVSLAENPMVITWNTKLVKPEEAPRGFQDLLDPRWKGKIAMDIEPNKEFNAMLVRWGEEKTRDYVRRLVRENDVQVRKGYTATLNALIAGEFPISHTQYLYKVIEMKEKGAPIGWVLQDPLPSGASAFAIANKTRRPYSTMLFAQHLAGEKAGAIIEKFGRLPTNPKVNLSKPDLQPVKTKEIQERFFPNNPDFAAKWDSISRDIVKEYLTAKFVK